MSDYFYIILVILRVLFVFLPQTGYIHPDEYFQSIEILAGRTFRLDANIPWEFNVTFPIRSMGVPCLTIGLSYNIFQAIDNFIHAVFNVSLITPYTLLVIPRLTVCALSFLIDYSVYKICVNNNEKYRSRLLILASSYVILLFGTRTFSNSLELIIFSLLLYYVADSIILSNIVVKQREYLNERYANAETVAQRAIFHKLRLFIANDSFRHCIQISTLTVIGFFNRPTFLAFAICPLFFWSYRGIGFKSVPNLNFYYRIICLIITAIPSIVFFILYDSFFYGYITWGEVGMLDVSIDSFVFPPLNFIRYNLDKDNVAKHGLHPRSLHLLVNIPLLFNILGVIYNMSLMNYGVKFLRRKYHLLPTIRSLKGLMLVSVIIPVSILSYMPHQEARFLIPVALPLIYLYAHDIYEEPTKTLTAKSSKNKPSKTSLETPPKSHKLLKLWLAINALSFLFFGILHQGGVFPLVRYLSNEIKTTPHYTKFNLITSHTYDIPKTLLMQPSGDRLYYRNKSVFKYASRVLMREEGGKNLDEVLKLFGQDLNITTTNNLKTSKNYLILPGSLDRDLNMILVNHPNITINSRLQFYPHVSTEALPDFTEFFNLLVMTEMKSFSFSEFVDSIYVIFNSFTLNLYEITLIQSNL